MKNVSIRIAGCIFVLGVLILSLACTPSTPNTNQAQNQTVSANESNSSETATMGTDGTCNQGSTLEDRKNLVKARIAELIRDNEKLAKQLDGEPPHQRRFEVDAAVVDNYIVVYVQSRIDGEDEIAELSEILNNFKDDKCVLKVRLVPPGTLPITPANQSAGFEWSLCQWPTQACPNGTCHELPCPLLTNSNTATNGNMNGNLNVNGNMNSNRSNAGR